MYTPKQVGPLEFRIPVPRANRYLLRLYFAETYEPYFAPGERVMQIVVNEEVSALIHRAVKCRNVIWPMFA